MSKTITKSTSQQHEHLPNGWTVLEFSNFIELSKAKYVPNNNEHLRCVELEHIEAGSGTILGWLDSAGQVSTKNKFRSGQTLFGKLRPYLRKYWLADFDGVCSSEIWVLSTRANEKCLPEFLPCVLQQERFSRVANVSSGSKMPRADWSYIASFPFSLPPINEQRAIAKVLGLMDVAISNVRETIEQKKLRKKYLMQSLLTGRKRLKGFRKKWQTFRFRELATESTARNNGKMSNDRLMAVSKFHGLIPMRERVQGASNYRCKTIGRNYFAYNPMRLNIGSLARWENDEPAMVSGDYVVFKCIEDRLDPRFFDFYRSTNEWANYVRRAGDGSVRVRIYFSHLGPLKLKLPPVDEQKTIAKIVGLADWEITLLETKAEFLQLQKKWLMQVLLTGKRRLKVGK